eukprot:CAMPEP_0173081678 /NCGR_PEP_ID=MMETSP1102-20130122/17460_1 /TAXON_ID=49646 /ORGANISM="Geminigera sp., Strain Caron Lab Isolate" /LENGTH=181 /DNA_ID=CAMNT_0013956393 /DNA_START=135 /DNA_END=677 /DNA_ORIENTATION=+
MPAILCLVLAAVSFSPVSPAFLVPRPPFASPSLALSQKFLAHGCCGPPRCLQYALRRNAAQMSLQKGDADHIDSRGSGEALEEKEGAAMAMIRSRMNHLHGKEAEEILDEGLMVLQDVRASKLVPTTDNFNFILYLISRAKNASPPLLDRALGALTQEGLEANTKTYNLLICADKPRTAHL